MQPLRRDQDGFSVVVGVILLIVVVFALAATVWFMVDRVQQDTSLDEGKPDLGVQVDGNEPALTVVQASGDLDYVRDLRFSGTCTPTLNGGPLPSSEGRLVTANDRISCDWGESLAIASSDGKGNAVLFRHTF